MAESCTKICSGTGKDLYSLMGYRLAEIVHKLMVLAVENSCIPSRFNVATFLRPYRFDELPLKERAEFGLGRDFSQYFGISGSVIAQQLYTSLRRCNRSIMIGVVNGETERAWHQIVR